MKPRVYKDDERTFYCPKCSMSTTFFVAGEIKPYECKVECEQCGHILTWYLSNVQYRILTHKPVHNSTL